MYNNGKHPFLFTVIKASVRLFYPKMEVIGTENLPSEPVILVGNHSQLHGPIACELFFSDSCYTWCAGQMMTMSEVPAYAFEDFWSQKPKYTHWYYKLTSYLIAPLSVLIFNNARTVAVHRDTRIMNTFRETVNKLSDGNSIVIFPEHDVRHNNIIYDFKDRFIDIARLYFKKTGKEISFVPLYIAPKLKKMYIGKPVKYSASTEPDKERRRICNTLMNEITEIAVALPLHTVIPYRNIKKKLYPTNKITEEKQ